MADAQFSIRGNASYLHNELIELGNDTGWAAYDSFQGVGTITRAMNGEPFPYFYGLKTAGIFQTQEEIDALVEYTKSHGGIEYAERRMEELRRKCMSYIENNVTDAEIKSALTAYLDFVIERTK